MKTFMLAESSNKGAVLTILFYILNGGVMRAV